MGASVDKVKEFLNEHPHKDCEEKSLHLVLELCPEDFQFLDTFRLHKIDDINFAHCDGNDLLLIADDNMDGCKLAVSSKGSVMVYDPSD